MGILLKPILSTATVPTGVVVVVVVFVAVVVIIAAGAVVVHIVVVVVVVVAVVVILVESDLLYSNLSISSCCNDFIFRRCFVGISF